jgi:hypothetical protein
MARVLSIDPGRITGWAWTTDGKLISAGVQGEWPVDGGIPDVLVIEVPHAAWRASTEDMITLGRRIGRWEQWARRWGKEIVTYDVNAWKGSVPKHVHHKRIQAALNTEELARVPRMSATKAGNMWDAIGLNLRHCGRLAR